MFLTPCHSEHNIMRSFVSTLDDLYEESHNYLVLLSVDCFASARNDEKSTNGRHSEALAELNLGKFIITYSINLPSNKSMTIFTVSL